MKTAQRISVTHTLPRDRRLLKSSFFLCLLLAAVGSVRAADETVTGNLTVTGVADVFGNTFNLGTTSASGAPQGISFTFTDGSATTPSTFTLGSSRVGNIWVWSHNSASGLVPTMKLDEASKLTLFAPNYNVANVNSGKVVITPSTVGSTITIDGEPLLTQNVANATFLTQGTADSRYAKSTDFTVTTGTSQWGTGPAIALTGGSATGDNSFAGINAAASGGASNASGISSTASGLGSTASGYYSIASGFESTAYGGYSTASGIGSTAGGYQSTASGVFSTATAFGSTASGNDSTASGINSTASGRGSIASGYASNASGESSIASGNYSIASGNYSIASGIWSTASRDNAIASGYASTASGYYSIASGTFSTASEFGSIASGYASTASGVDSSASVYGSYATGTESVASGVYSTANGNNSIASGVYSTANGDYSTAIGTFSTASGLYSVSAGYMTLTAGFGQFVIGQFNLEQGDPTEWVPTDDLFQIGNGTDSGNLSNAFVVKKNGDTVISGRTTAKGGIVVPGVPDPQAPNPATATIVATQLVLIPQQGDLSMGSFTAGAKPQ